MITALTEPPCTDELELRIRSLGDWFHKMNLGGVDTAPNHPFGNYPHVKWRHFAHALPQDLSGRTVLDIGCNAGFYSLEMKRRGADRVVGIDSDPRYLAQARLASEISGLQIDLQQLSVYEVAQLREKFDVVIFMGVFYHLRHPLLALDLIHEHVSRDLLLFQSMQRGSDQVMQLEVNYPYSEEEIFDRPEFPKMHFVEGEFVGDPTNWWIPNRACVEAMLRSAGYEIVDHPEAEVYVCRHVKQEVARG